MPLPLIHPCPACPCPGAEMGAGFLVAEGMGQGKGQGRCPWGEGWGCPPPPTQRERKRQRRGRVHKRAPGSELPGAEPRGLMLLLGSPLGATPLGQQQGPPPSASGRDLQRGDGSAEYAETPRAGHQPQPAGSAEETEASHMCKMHLVKIHAGFVFPIGKRK